MYAKSGMDKTEMIKFTLAAYNAGEGRIADCRNFAASKGIDKNSWDEIVSLIPLMREDSILEEKSVKLGKFKGHETIAYVNNVMSLYESFCTIHPSI
jgi:membrane-bound lytic murein transglycosylase F